MIDDALNRSDLIKQLAEVFDIDTASTDQIVKTILNCMSEALENGERIEIRGFGSFELRYREPRMARNPKTGERVQTHGKYAIHFKPGKELKERVNDSLHRTDTSTPQFESSDFGHSNWDKSDDDSNGRY